MNLVHMSVFTYQMLCVLSHQDSIYSSCVSHVQYCRFYVALINSCVFELDYSSVSVENVKGRQHWR